MKKNIVSIRNNKKKISNIKSMPLTIIIIISMFLVSIVGALGMCFGVYDKEVSFERPFVAAVFTGKKESSNTNEVNIINGEDEPVIIELPSSSQDNTLPDNNNNNSESDSEKDPKKGKVEYIKRTPAKPRSPYYDDPEKTPLSTNMDYKEVGDDYFGNTLFIGDSRIEGLAFYGNIPNAEFIYKQGIQVWDLFEQKLETNNHGKIMLYDLFKSESYTKIYIMIGINELGKGTPEDFKAKYSEVLATILNYQPKAKIFIFGIMNVTKEYSDKSEWLNNDNINARNCRIAELSNGKNIVYLDMNTVINDDSGAMNPDYTTDGVHLRAEYYSLWTDFIKKHGLE